MCGMYRGIFDRHEAAPPLGGFSPPGLVFSQPALLGWTVDFSRKRAGGGRRATASVEALRAGRRTGRTGRRTQKGFTAFLAKSLPMKASRYQSLCG